MVLKLGKVYKKERKRLINVCVLFYENCVKIKAQNRSM